MRQKGFVEIIVLAGILVVGISLFLIFKPRHTINLSGHAQITAPTLNWKTYKNDILSFKYPSEWEVGKTNIYGSSNETEFIYNYGKPLYLDLRANYNQTTGKPYSTLEEYWVSLSKVSTNITIDNQDAKYYYSKGGGHNIASEKVVTFSPDKSTIVELLYQPDYYIPGNKEFINQILSSFNYLDISPTPQVTNLTREELNRGWYWGFKDQKKPGTPNNWVYSDAGRSSCWHKPEITCFFE